ncbi:uncharacterized protein LOC134259668 [Saccostrea cucullata]|uniref:uncharacterized protein LOC134259668 n=1 Tax=Saccostrea cuccullata TaxID=36930 RepID=UPI002ED0937A
MPFDSLDAKTHVCSRHLTLSRSTFPCSSSSDATVNFRAMFGALLRKSLKTQQQSFQTFQKYLRIRTPYVTDWSLFSMRPCLRIRKRCSECSSMNQHHSGRYQSLHSRTGNSSILEASTKQLLCEIHTFLLSGTNNIGDGFINDVIKSNDWCVFSSISSRYERDIYLLRQIASISSRIYNRYKTVFL